MQDTAMMNPERQEHKISLLVFGAVMLTITLWASAFVGIRVGLQGYSPGDMALLRYITASIGMVFLYFRLPQRQSIALKEIPTIIFIGMSGIGIYNIALNYGEISVNAGIASFIVGLMPVMTNVLAVVFLKENVNLIKWLGIGISVVGMLLIAIGEHAGVTFNWGVVYCLIATLMVSVYTVTQKPLLKKYHPIEIASFAIWGGTLIMLVFLPHLIHHVATANWHITATVIYMGLFPGCVAYASWSYALSKIPASRASVFLYFMPIFATIMGWLWLGEVPYLLSIIGGLVALVGAMVVNLSPNKIPVVKNNLK